MEISPGVLLVEHPALGPQGRGVHFVVEVGPQELKTMCVNRLSSLPLSGAVPMVPDVLASEPLWSAGVDGEWATGNPPPATTWQGNLTLKM